MVLSIFLYEAYLENWGVLWTVIASVSSCIGGLIVFIYFIRLRQSDALLRKMKAPIANICFSNDGVTTHWGLGHSHVKWDFFDEVLEIPRVWLLVYGKSGFMTLPVLQ